MEINEDNRENLINAIENNDAESVVKILYYGESHLNFQDEVLNFQNQVVEIDTKNRFRDLRV